MTIQFDIAKLNSLDELLAVIDAGEDMTLTRNGKVIATVNVERSAEGLDAPKAQRRLGVWEHLRLDLPADLFIGPDPEIEALMDEPIFPRK
jgi:antitoxin (DNA-binding transcriptional repressor) of toxin-antitoxin stability system